MLAVEFDYSDLVVESENLDLFVEFCSTLTLQQREQMVVHAFQQLMLSDYFRGCPLTTVILPKKLGKTTLIAAVCLFHILTTDDAEVAICARSKEQAGRLYDHIRKFVAKQRAFDGVLEVRPGFKEIRRKGSMSKIKVLSGDQDTLEGIECTLWIAEEVGQWEDGEPINVLSEGARTRNGQGFIISNAGDNEDGPLGLIRQRCYKYGHERHGAYRYCKSPNGSEVLHEWALDPDQDHEDLHVVKQAHPAPWKTIAVLRADREEALSLSRWLRYHCGIWVKGGSRAIMPWEWDSLPKETIPYKATAFIGVDVGRSEASDTTAITPVRFKSLHERIIGDPIILVPPAEEGKRLDFRAIYVGMAVMAGFIEFDEDRFITDLTKDDMNDLADVKGWAEAIKQGSVVTATAFVYDPAAGAEDMFERFARKYPKCKPFEFAANKASSNVRADMRFMEALGNLWLRHSGHRGLREHALNAVEQPSGSGFFFGHGKRPRLPQDALKAASMAHDMAVEQKGTGPVKAAGGVFFL